MQEVTVEYKNNQTIFTIGEIVIRVNAVDNLYNHAGWPVFSIENAKMKEK